MRLLRLDLLRYGHLTDLTLDFPAGAALHVVQGANEAGKSTALEAIADALFGFRHQTSRDFLHEAKALRIGFTLADEEGRQAGFQRRKGRQGTLLDAAETPLPEEALRRFLGGASRELFERGFGLDGERLRRGGRSLLESGGEAGESLLAGMGMPQLHKALGRLEEEAKSLAGDRRTTRRFAAALEAWQQARREAEEAAIRPRDWEEAVAAREAILQAVARARAENQALVAEASRLQRIRRVRPRLAELDRVREALAAVAAAPRLPAGTEERLRQAAEARRAAAQDAAREAEVARRLAAARAALAEDPAVLALQDGIDTLAAQRPLLLQAEAELPRLRAERADYRAAAEAAARELGAAEPVESLRERLPPESDRRRAQALLTERATRQARQAHVLRDLREAERQRDAASAALAALPAPPPSGPLRRAIEAARGEGPLDRELERARHALDRAAEEARAALAALPLWQGDAAALAACPLPLPAEEAAAAGRLAAAEQGRERAREEEAGLAAEIEALEAEQAALAASLAADGAVPTREAVAAARTARDAAWRRLRRGVEDGVAAGPAATAEFEALGDAADRLADRRAEEAQRVADYALRQARLVQAQRRREAAVAARQAAEARLAEARAGWEALWAAAGLRPAAPEAMTEWRRAREGVLARGAAERAARQACAELAARREAARGALAGLFAPAPEGAALAPLLAAADEACREAEAALLAHRARAEALAAEEARLPGRREAAAEAARAVAALEAGWAEALASLGLPPMAEADRVETALAAWARIAEAAQAWRVAEQRIAALEEVIAGFETGLRAVLERLPEAAAEAAPAVLAQGLSRRLEAARKTAEEAARLDAETAAHAAAAAAAERRGAAAGAEIAALQAAAGLADEAALEAAIGEARRRDGLEAELAALERLLAEQGDGLAEAELRAEAASLDADAAQARLAAIEGEQVALAEGLRRLGGEQATVEERLAGMQRGRDAAAHAQAAEQALAEARAAAERYGRLHLARRLLQAGIDRFRNEQQTPLLRAAGGHFALLTGGRYARLAAEEDEKGRVLLRAVRGDGSDCAVEALSEGTRDQLYLALRVAWIEHHAAHAAPLPFVADDLLVHFDDARAAAALDLLAQLGARTQVILFTHHDHIAALAARQAGVHLQRLPAQAGGLAARSAA